MSDTEVLNPRAVIGDNQESLPRQIAKAEEYLPAEVKNYLDEEHAGIPRRLEELLDRAREIPREIADDETMGTAAKIVKELRDLTKEIEATHAKESGPYFRSKQACDNWFFSLWDKAVRRAKTNRPGAADILNGRIDDYQQRKLRAEQERRRQEEERLRREAEEARRAEEAALRKAEEDRLAAERARKPETKDEKGAVAAQAEAAAAAASVEADLAVNKAQQARIETFAKPADIVRTRVEEGPTVTMARENYAMVVDEKLLDREKLWPFISLPEKEKAVRAWAKTTGYGQQMAGAEIGSRPKTVVR